MPGLKGQARTPRENTRSRRNAQNLATVTDFVTGSFSIEVDGDGYLQIVLASGSVLAQDSSGLDVTIGTGVQNDGGTLKSKDSEIVHDNLSGFVGNEHIDWTNATVALVTTNSGTFGSVIVDNITLNAATIVSDSGAISFDDENLTTTGLGTFGSVVVDNLTLAAATLLSDTGTVGFGDDHLVTTGGVTAAASTFGDGGTTNYAALAADGDLTFVGTAGLSHGGMGQENVPTTITIAVAGTAVIVDGMSGGDTNNVTFQNAQELKVGKAGKYYVVWSVSFNMVSSSGQECEGAIGLNGAAQSFGSAHRKIAPANDTGDMSGCAIMDLAVDDLITIMVTNETSTVDIVIAHAGLILVQVGGT